MFSKTMIFYFIFWIFCSGFCLSHNLPNWCQYDYNSGTIITPIWHQWLVGLELKKAFPNSNSTRSHTYNTAIYILEGKRSKRQTLFLSLTNTAERAKPRPHQFSLIFNFEQVYSQTSLFLYYSQTLCRTKLEAIGFCCLQCFSCDLASLYKDISIDFTRVSFHSYLCSIKTLTN